MAGKCVVIGELTDKQERLAYYLAQGGVSAARAAVAAGYSSNPASTHKALQSERLRARVAEIREKLQAEGAELGFNVLCELARDPNCPPPTRRAAASDLLRFSGISSATTEDGEAVPLHQMTAEQLSRTAAVLTARLAQIEADQRTLEGVLVPDDRDAEEVTDGGIFD